MNKLIKLRTQNKITKDAMAALLQVSKAEYDLYEAHPLNMPTSMGYRIAKIFGVKMSEIFLP